MSQSTEIAEPQILEQRIEAVKERIERACQRVGRSSNEVSLIGVTKTFSPAVVEAAVEAGLRHFGENRVQELVEKAEMVPGRLRGGEITWHMVGHLQRNKAKDVVEYADTFHALDSARLAKELNRRASQAGRTIPCFVQANVSHESQKFGVDPRDVHSFLDVLASFEHLQIVGLMAIATFTENPEDVRSEFRHLRELSETYPGNRTSRVIPGRLSMGMSGDFEVAIEEGATEVRVGSAIFGMRT